jgi:hypothetical protein
VVRAAADRTIAAGSARVDVTIAQDTAGTGFSGTGTADLSRQQAALTFGRTGAAAHLDDRFRVVVDRGQEDVAVTSGRGAPGMPGTSPARPWLAGPPRRLAAVGHDRMAPLDSLLVRPGMGTALAFLRGAVDVRPYGGQEIRGVNTLRLSMEVDLPTAIANSPAGQRPALEAAAAAIGPVQWPVDVWIDEQGRVRRIELAEDPELHTTTTKGNLLITDDGNPLALTDVDFSDFGVPANISLPVPDQVVEAQ